MHRKLAFITQRRHVFLLVRQKLILVVGRVYCFNLGKNCHSHERHVILMVCMMWVLCLLKEDEDGQHTVLQIIEDLMDRCPDVYLDHFARLGVFNKVLAIAGPALEDEEGAVCREGDKVGFQVCSTVRPHLSVICAH